VRVRVKVRARVRVKRVERGCDGRGEVRVGTEMRRAYTVMQL